jgi:hypothetical protein
MHLIGRKEHNLMGRQLKWTAAVALVAVCCLAACGTIAKLTTEQAVADSFSRLQNQSSLSVALSVGLTPNEMATLSKRNGGSAIPANVANSLSKAAIVFSISTGHGESIKSKQATSDPANSYDVALQIGLSTPLEIRYVNQTLYGRVQIPQLVSNFGQSASDGQSIQSALTKANQYVPGLAALAEGRWVSVSKASLQSLLGMLKTFGAGSLGSQSSPSNLNASVHQLEGSLKNALKNNASFSNAGTSGGRTKYNVTLALKSFIEQAGPAIQTFASSIPGGSGKINNADISKLASEVPAHATAQLFVKNDKAQEITVDLNQFVPANKKLPYAVPLQVVLGEPGAVSAPTGATSLNLSNLGQMVAGMMGGGFSSSSSSSVAAG